MRMLVKDIITEFSVRNKEGKTYPVYSVTNSQGFCKDYFGKEVASKDKSSYKIVPYGFFAYNPSRINVGSIDWQHCEEIVIVSPLYNVFEVNTSIAKIEYLSYYFKSRLVSDFINTFAKGTVRLNVPLSTLGDFPIPVPPLSEQHRIVSELDLLSSIIEKKKAQLKEYDQLAQSIFFDMFGDPVTNEKGWEVKKLGEVCKKITDGTHDTPQRLEKGVKFITGKHIRPFLVDYDNSDYVTEEVHKEIFQRCNPELGDVLYTNIGAGIGNAAINSVEYEFSMKNVALLKPLRSNVNGYYLEFYLNNDKIKTIIIDNYSNGGAQKFLSLKSIAKITVPLPPLSLQQSFAEKIEAIEKQKSLIQQSITETQTMFDYTMDKYFG